MPTAASQPPYLPSVGGRHQPPRAERHEAEHEHGQQPTEQAHRHDLLVDQLLRLLLQLVGLPAGRFDPLLDLLPAAELGDEVARRVEVLRQAELVAAGHRRFDLRADTGARPRDGLPARAWPIASICSVASIARACGVSCSTMSLVIRGGSLPAPVHSWLSRSFSLASRASSCFTSSASSPAMPLDGLQPILLLQQRFEPLAVADQHVVDAQPLGLVAKLLPLALEDVALPLVLFDALVEVVERCRACLLRAAAGWRSVRAGRRFCRA